MITYFWFFSCLFVFVCGFLKNIRLARYISSIVFLVFSLVCGMRSLDYNNDTLNYVYHFNSISESSYSSVRSIFLGGWFEPGYNGLVFLLSRVMGSDGFLVVITLLPGLIFTHQFIRFKYHPSVILYVLSSIAYVGMTTTARHFIALAIIFIVSNMIIYGRRNLVILAPLFFVAALFHYSSILVSASMVVDFLRKKDVGRFIKVMFLILLTIMAGIFVINLEFLYFLYDKLLDRIASDSGSTGLRNLSLIVLVFLVIYSRGLLVTSRLSFTLIFSIMLTIAIIVFGLMGVNRVVSFFIVVILTHLNFYHFRDNEKMTLPALLLNFMSLSSSIFIFLTFSRL